MPKFTYVGDDVRTYPTVPVTVSPGDVVELDEALDERWALVVPKPATKTAASSPAPAAPSGSDPAATTTDAPTTSTTTKGA